MTLIVRATPRRAATSRVIAILAVAIMTALVVAAPASAQKELPWTEVCRFDDRRLTEISGMAASLMHENVVWVHNDSSDAARLYALDLQTCDTVSELRLRGVQARDFEGLASTRNARGRAALWVGDIGDNRDSWPSVTLHRVWEPKTLGTRSRPVKSWDFTYPDRPHNAETLMVSGRSVWVATWQLATGGVYSVPLRRTVASAERLDDVGPLTTDGSIHPDERGYVLRDYLDVHFYVGLPPGRKVATFALPRQVQGEAITWTSDGTGLLIASEEDDRLLRVDPPWWVLAAMRPPDHLS
ncbi:MAG: hypothetical protein VW906_04140 [Actinomycetota bacterium]|jgi:hypothetical protein